MDDGKTLDAARHDPREVIRHDKSTLIIDEFQRAPDLLLAIKQVPKKANGANCFTIGTKRSERLIF